MDIKLKSINKKYIKVIVYFLLCMTVSVGLLSLTEIKENYKYTKNNNIFFFDGIAETMDNYTVDVVDYALYYKNSLYIKDKENITLQDRIICQNEIDQKVNIEFENFSSSIQNTEGFLKLTDEEKEQILDEEKAKIEEKYYLDEKEFEDYIIARKLKSGESLINKIEGYKNLDFVVHDVQNDIWINGTGLDSENIRNRSLFVKEIMITNDRYSEKIYDDENKGVVKDNLESSYYIETYMYDKISFPDSTYGDYNLNIYIGVNKDIVEGDPIYDSWKRANERSHNIRINVFVAIIAIIISIILVTLIYRYDLQERFTDKIVERFKDSKLEYKLIILIFLVGMLSIIGEGGYYHYIETLTYRNIIIAMIITTIAYIVFKILSVNYREGNLFNNNITMETVRRLKYVMSKGTMLKTLFWGAVLYGVIIAILLIIVATVFYDPFMFIIPALIVTVMFGVAIIKNIIYLDIIMISTKEGAEGKLTGIEELGKGKLREFAKNINSLNDGLRQSLENEFKSEKMKTELITNVSHDLKTPLTSIINYIDLLKLENLESEAAVDYINVLDKKSKRLQILIEDLFEVSKATSGAMELNIEKIEITQLLNQAIGENQDKLLSSGLSLKLDVPEEKVFIDGDGKRLYRVLENLISNISKYSMKNTRVYVSLIKSDDYIKITMKNISSYELNFDASEITDRFKRGDQARTTEGSGLGLAISKSIVELHKGSFNIDIDGDLFKVTVLLKRE